MKDWKIGPNNTDACKFGCDSVIIDWLNNNHDQINWQQKLFLRYSLLIVIGLLIIFDISGVHRFSKCCLCGNRHIVTFKITQSCWPAFQLIIISSRQKLSSKLSSENEKEKAAFSSNLQRNSCLYPHPIFSISASPLSPDVTSHRPLKCFSLQTSQAARSPVFSSITQSEGCLAQAHWPPVPPQSCTWSTSGTFNICLCCDVLVQSQVEKQEVTLRRISCKCCWGKKDYIRTNKRRDDSEGVGGGWSCWWWGWTYRSEDGSDRSLRRTSKSLPQGREKAQCSRSFIFLSLSGIGRYCSKHTHNILTGSLSTVRRYS